MKITLTAFEEMKLLDRILPPLADGKYQVCASQEIEFEELKDGENIKTSETFNASSEFAVSGRAFSMPSDAVFSLYPGENAEGNFSNELPFIVLKIKTLPWQYDCGGDPLRPWVALIVLGPGDHAVEKDITVRELLRDSSGNGLFYPSGSQPEFYTESGDDLCHVVDIPVNVYQAILPKADERPYLSHGKYVNLSRTEEAVSCMDGFFSVVIGNRFLPSNDNEAVKSTVHLVSLLGYDGVDLNMYTTVRLCSLFRWNVFSRSSQEAGFGPLIQGIDSAEFGGGKNVKTEEDELKRRGVIAYEHRFRTGETSASLYCSPLVPAKAPALDMTSRRTADGHLIYDKTKGVFDAKYACAFQLGRMITMSDEAMALKILRWRRGLNETMYRQRLHAGANANMPNYAELCINLNAALNGREEQQ